MKKALCLMAMAGLACSLANGQVIISEVLDGPQTGGNPKMVEITNVGNAAVTLDSTYTVEIYFNGQTTSTILSAFGTTPVVLAPGQSYTISSLANGGQAQWDAAFGAANQPSRFLASGGPFMGNGDDVYTLEINNVVVDSYGTIGERPAAGTSWNYEDSFARRNPNVCTPNATFTLSEWVSRGSNWTEIPNQNGTTATNLATWTNNVGWMASPNAHANTCAGRANDCDGNGVEDFTQTAGGTNDLDGNRVPDSCDVQFGFALDCNNNLIPDVSEVETSTLPDANGNGIPDPCEGLLFDCNGNFIEDATDILNGTSVDCNANNVPDECELRSGGLTDANDNDIPDACAPDNAFVGETTINATVQAAGVRSGSNGDAFFNIEGPAQVNLPPTPNGEFRSYGGLRFPIAPVAARFDTAFGAGQWEVAQVYLVLTQQNAGFTANGDVVAYYSNNDAISFANGETSTQFDNFATDFADRQAAATWTFTQVSNGTVENHVLFDVAVSGNAGGEAIATEIESGTGDLTLVLKDSDATPEVAATYAGYTNFNSAGPTLVVFARQAVQVTGSCCIGLECTQLTQAACLTFGGVYNGDGTNCGTANCVPTCAWQADGCFADYTNDEGIDGDDVIAFFADWDSSGDCADVDNSDGVDGDDVILFFAAWDVSGTGFPGC